MRRRHLTALAAPLLLAACGGGGDDDGFGPETEAVFLESCTAGLPAGGVDVCQCAYDRVSGEMTFDEYRALDREIRDDPELLPQAVNQAVVRCAAEVLYGHVLDEATTTSTSSSTTTTKPD